MHRQPQSEARGAASASRWALALLMLLALLIPGRAQPAAASAGPQTPAASQAAAPPPALPSLQTGGSTISPRFPVDEIPGEVWYHAGGSEYHELQEGWQRADDTYTLDLNVAGDLDNRKPVYAVEDGVVEQLNACRGYILLKHTRGAISWKGNTYATWYSGYMHMDDIPDTLAVGSTVTRAQQLGVVAGRGGNCGNGDFAAHLHFGLYVGRALADQHQNIFLESVDPYEVAGFRGLSYAQAVHTNNVDELNALNHAGSFTLQGSLAGRSEAQGERSFYEHSTYISNTQTTATMTATWSFDALPFTCAPGSSCYKAYVFIPNLPGHQQSLTGNAIYTLYNQSDVQVLRIAASQALNKGTWVRLGFFSATQGDQLRLVLTNRTGSGDATQELALDTVKIAYKDDALLYYNDTEPPTIVSSSQTSAGTLVTTEARVDDNAAPPDIPKVTLIVDGERTPMRFQGGNRYYLDLRIEAGAAPSFALEAVDASGNITAGRLGAEGQFIPAPVPALRGSVVGSKNVLVAGYQFLAGRRIELERESPAGSGRWQSIANLPISTGFEYRHEDTPPAGGPSCYRARGFDGLVWGGYSPPICLEPTILVLARPDGSDGCTAIPMARNDDGSSSQVTLPFSVNFFGRSFSQLYVNNNGNVTFDAALSTFTPFSLQSTSRSIIAPFFADVDTRSFGSQRVTYSYGATTYAGRPAFCVDWVDVGYYNSHADKLNSFQLLLVERADMGQGDFDIIFNYSKIRWETGDASGGSSGLGGSSARIGFSNGQSLSFELPGSGVNGAFLDSNTASGLIYSSQNSTQPGRYLFAVRNGQPPTGGTLSGTVYAQSIAPANVLSGAPVQVCGSSGLCRLTTTSSAGSYFVAGLATGSYSVTAFPPAGSTLVRQTRGPIQISASGGAGQNLVLTGPLPPPPGTTITSRRTAGGGIPLVYWGDPLRLTTRGCEGGSASYTLTQAEQPLRSGVMAEVTAGTYQATLDPLRPQHGYAQISIAVDGCLDGSTSLVRFDLYIDPSGAVRTTGGAPIAGATVKLYRSDSAIGPFTLVPYGSALMSPANRSNPDLTDADGHFGWDVVTGYYKVRAEKAGCVSPANPAQYFVETPVMTIPPPVTDLDLRLSCELDATPPEVVCAPADGQWHADNVDRVCTAVDGGSGLADPADQSFTLTTTVPDGVETQEATTDSRQVCDQAGNCAQAGPLGGSWVDRRPPEISIGGLADGASYLLGSLPTPSCDATDAGSGLAGACAGSLSGGTPAGVGLWTYTATASDRVGNVATRAVSVRVVYPFTGFLQPVDNLPALNTVTAGRAIPIKFSLGGDRGLGILAEGYPKSQSIACDSSAPLLEVEETLSAGSSSLSYGDGRYQYVWKTGPEWAGTCRRLLVQLVDGSVHTASFKFR